MAQREESQREESQRWFDSTWAKVHPLSPFVRGWLTVVAVPGIIFGYNWELWADLWRLYRSGELWQQMDRNPMAFLAGGGGLLLVMLLIFGGFVLSWWFTRYKITDDHVMVKSGILVRQHRQAHIDRVQAVDLRQPLLARLTGLAELKFEVAEGDGTAATLAFLRRSEAEQLRVDIMDRASGRTQWREQQRREQQDREQHGHQQQWGTEEIAPPDQGLFREVPDRHITGVPTGRLVGSVITGWGTVMIVILMGFGVVGGLVGLTFALSRGDSVTDEASAQVGQAITLLSAGALPALIPLGIVVITVYYQQFSSGYRFTATMTGAGLRLRYGLLETTTQTVPPGRVQAMQIQQPLLWRPFGWFRVLVVVAGYGAGEKRSVLLPVGRRQEVMAVTAAMFPDLRVPCPERILHEGLTGSGTGIGFTEVPARAWIFDPIVRRRRGFLVTPSTLMFRDGRASRRLTLVAHERIQSLALHQGPWQRVKRLATIHIHSPSGPFQAQLANQDIDAAKWLFHHEASHAAFARRMRDRNQWMLPEELHEFERMVTPTTASPEPRRRS